MREQAKDENGRTMGFVNFGPVDFVKYESSQPLNITWKLKHPMPAYLWHETPKLAVNIAKLNVFGQKTNLLHISKLMMFCALNQ